MIPFIDLKRFEDGFLTEWESKVSKMSKDASFIGGSEVQDLESQLQKYSNIEYAISCANGTDAIQVALRATGIEPGDVVLVPNLTFWATFEAVVNVGGLPVLVDISLEDGGVDFSSFEAAVHKYKPKAAVVAHLFGWGTPSLKLLRQLCTEQSVVLIEDGAQCFGTLFEGGPIYEGAYVSTTSFYPAKVLGAAGDAGAVFTNDSSIAKKARQLCNHGRSTHYGYEYVGWNSRMDSLQAAYLNLALKYLDSRIASRRKASEFYRENLNANLIKIMGAPENYIENGYCNVILIEDLKLKNKIENELKSNSVGFGNIYPSTISSQACTSDYMHGETLNGNANLFCQQVLNLPLFPYMTEQELDKVCQLVNSIAE